VMRKELVHALRVIRRSPGFFGAAVVLIARSLFWPRPQQVPGPPRYIGRCIWTLLRF
jgi:hypothetical protein